jgi:DNA (cytosine-5)-methyltransferase 1
MHKGINSTLDEGQTPVVVRPIDFRNLRFHDGDVAGTMQSKATGGYSLNYETGVMQPVVAFQSVDHAADASVELSPTMRAHDPMAVMAAMQVRRLTPVECERLQGFPDGYTNIPWRNKPESPDGPRYKALGNSWAVPVVRWIGERIHRAIA